MADPTTTPPVELRVRLDDDLRADLTRAHELTGIKADSELVRYAIRLVARGNGRTGT